MSCQPPNPKPVVIDNGSYTLKCGFAGDKAPRFELPSNNAIQEGNVVQWDKLTEIWKDAFTKLDTIPEKQPILLSEPILTATSDREKMAEIMFEGMNASSIYLAKQPVLSLYATGRMDGAVVQIGHGVAQVIASSQGFAVPSSCMRNTLAGQKLNQYVEKLLSEEGVTGVSADAIRDIKEKHGYVALDFEKEEQQLGATNKPTYTLPDGKEVVLGRSRFACPEALFRPNIAGFTDSSVQTLLKDAITNAAAEKKISSDTFFKDVVVTGGSSLFPGFKDRFTTELKAFNPSVEVTEAPGVNSCFIGGSILTCLATMTPLWVTKQMYLDSGATIVNEKCV